jgi:hypothetical protein
MNAQATAWVWDHSAARGTAKLVLLCLANHYSARDEAAVLSVAELSVECGISERAVQTNLRKLEDLDEIVVVEQRGDDGVTLTPWYGFPLLSLSRQVDQPGVTNLHPEGVKSAPSSEQEERVETPGRREGAESAPPTDSREVTTPPPPKRATRCPEPFMLTAEMREWAAKLGLDHDGVREATREFVDYWRGVPGARGTKLDWTATWRNSVRLWVRRTGSAVRSGSGASAVLPTEPGGRR